MNSNILIDKNNSYKKVKLGEDIKAILERGITMDIQQITELNEFVETNQDFNPQQAIDALHEVDATKDSSLNLSLANKVLQDLTYDFKTLAMYGVLTPELYPKREWVMCGKYQPVATQVPWNPGVFIPSFDNRQDAIAWANQYLSDWESVNGTSPVRFNGALV